MESLPDYDAISYVWGDPTDTSPIKCSGKTLSITKNLHSALRHFRLQDQPCVLWVDAICISQADVYERGQQVSIMKVIYPVFSMDGYPFKNNVSISNPIREVDIHIQSIIH
jgi:hypothetical protein